MFKISQQLNIVGKRSGEGFVAHKAKLATALSRCLADRLTLMDLTIGRKGFLNFVKALGGSNVVKIVPASSHGNAGGSQVADKRLKVVCGAGVSFIADGTWIKEKTPMVFADVRVSPQNIVNPNISSLELAEALSRVLPFTSNDKEKPILQNILVKASEGKLILVGADGVRLAVQRLDYDEGIDNAVLVHKADLKGIATALKRARRVNISFADEGELALIIETEAIRYRLIGNQGTYPDYESYLPTDLNCLAHFDSIEAVKALGSLKAIADPKSFAIDLTIGEGKVLMASPDENGTSTISADTDGQGDIRIDGKYLTDVLRACNGMVDLTLTNAYSPMMFSTDGYSCVVMPMASVKANQQREADRKAKQPAEQQPAEQQPEAEKQPAEAKKQKRAKKQPVPA